MVQEATIAPITLLPSEVRAALPHTLPAAASVLPGPQQPGGVGLGLVWLLWGGVLGLPLKGTVVPSIQHMTGGGWLAMGWLSGTDSVHRSAATSTGEPQLWASFGCQTGLNHRTHLVQKAPKANRQKLVRGLPSGSHLCSSPGSISGLPPGGGCFSVLPQPSSDSTAAGTTGGALSPAGRRIRSLMSPVSSCPRPVCW